MTDDKGNYLLTDVPLGQFTIMPSLPGFAEKELAVLLENQNAVTVDITLELAELQFEITVVPDTAELMNASDSIGVVSVLPSQVAALPSLGEKDIYPLARLLFTAASHRTLLPVAGAGVYEPVARTGSRGDRAAERVPRRV